MNFWQRHWRRAYIGFIAFVLFYAVEIISPLIIGVDISQPDTIPTSLLIVLRLVQIVTVTLASLWHFAHPKVVASLKEGLWFGITYEIAGFIIDLLVMVISVVFPNTASFFRTGYGTALFVVSIVVALGIPMLVGKLRSAHK